MENFVDNFQTRTPRLRLLRIRSSNLFTDQLLTKLRERGE